MSTVIVNLGFGNIASVAMALERLGTSATITADPSRIREADRLILPGVGAANFAAQQIEALGIAGELRSFPRPLLGICLGMQMLYEDSEEGVTKGLRMLRGRVERLVSAPTRPVPHMGWNQLNVENSLHPLLDGVSTGEYVYFVHSYAAPITDETIASCSYGRSFAAIAGKGSLLGCQFHPERSGRVGEKILHNFLNLPLV